MEIREYCDRSGRSLFREWFSELDAEAARRITAAVYRLGSGNFSNAKGVGGGIFESKVHFGPGYRIYFGKDGGQIVILLGGGTKQRQQRDIAAALARWADYKLRKEPG